MSRNQYHPVRCGACGKKGAYVIRYEQSNRVRCRYCGADERFYDYAYLDGVRVWPGTLEEAAASLRIASAKEKP